MVHLLSVGSGLGKAAICKYAELQIGQSGVIRTRPNDSSPEATTCEMFFPIVRDIAIDSFQWSFVPYLLFYSNAREFDKYRQAGSITYYDVKDEDYQRLKMRSIPYCGGRFLLGSEEETKLFPSYFTNVLIFGLASRLASSQGSFTTSRFMDTKYKEALAEARVIDADDPCDIDDCYWRPYPHKNNRGYCRDRIC